MLAGLAVGLVGCSDETPGNALAETTTDGATEDTRPTETTGKSTTSKPGSGDSPLADTEPCSLLSADGAAQLGVSDGQEKEVGRARVCDWQVKSTSTTRGFTLGVAIFDDLGIKDVVSTGEIKPVPTVGTHEAVESGRGAGGVCAISMAITETSRVDAEAVSGGDINRACELAMQLATLVEPELP